MKTPIYSARRQQGSVLAASLVIAFIIGATLVSYMVMTQSQNTSVVRSQIWNSSIMVTEAGVEDALAMLNKYVSNFDKLHEWTNSASLIADNWNILSANVYHARRSLGDNYYDVYITNLNNQPIIYSIGTANWSYSYASAPLGFLATVNGLNGSGGTPLRRKLEVKTKVDPLFNVAMAALTTINLNGKTMMTDSFDSSDPNYSENGQYPTNVNKTKAGGDVVTNGTIEDTLNVGNAKIKGLVKTGPNGTIAIGPGGSVGDRAWVEGGSTGIQDGHSSDDMNVLFPQVEMPDGANLWTPPPLLAQNVVINGTIYNYAFLTSGDYVISGNKNFGGNVYVAPNANVRVWVKLSGLFQGNDRIDLMSDSTGSGTLEIYSSGSFTVQDSASINNYSGNAANFSLFGLPTCTLVKLVGNAKYIGVIYAPNALLQLGGGGKDAYDFIGASVSKSVTLNGHFNFHYDENLRNKGMGRGYIPTSWAEVR